MSPAQSVCRAGACPPPSGRKTIKRLMPKQNPERRRIRLAAEVYAEIGVSPTCDIVTFAGQFKNLAQREAWRRGITGALWQTSFWDHCLRGAERREPVVADVRNNPVRSELVERWCDDRVSGSSVFGLADAGGGQAPALQRKLG